MSHFGVTGFVSTVNSTSSILTATSVFTGTSEDVSHYATITVFVDSDQDGSLAMQFSIDGTNWDRAKTVAVDQTIGTGSVHTLEVVSQYFRIVYTNGSTNQTHFRLQSLYHNARSGFLTSSPDEQISRTNDAQLIRVSNDPFLDLSRGLYKDKSVVHKFGANEGAPAAERDVWQYGDTAIGNIDYNWLQAADTVRIAAGGNAADTSAGAGARTVTIEGLDSNWELTSEVLTTNGASASTASSTSFIRLHRAYVSDVGTYTGSNTGAITLETAVGGDVLGHILAGLGQTQLTMYTVPLNYTGYLRHAHGSVSAGTNKDSTLTMYRRLSAEDVAAPMTDGGKRLMHRWEQLQGVAELDFLAMPSLPAQTDVWWTSKGNTSSISVVYDLILVKNDSPTNPQ